MGARRRREGGYVTVEFVAVVAFSLLLLVMLANLIVIQYGRGVLRAAAEEGAQTGSRLFAGVAECEQRASEVITAGLGGPMGDGVAVSCATGSGTIVATVIYSFEPWLPLVPVFSGSEESVAVKEELP